MLGIVELEPFGTDKYQEINKLAGRLEVTAIITFSNNVGSFQFWSKLQGI